MNIPQNYIFVCSFNTRLYNHSHNLFMKYMPELHPENQYLIFHENSFDLTRYNQSIDLSKINLKNCNQIDLFEKNNWLENFLTTSKFKDCYQMSDYYLKNSPFWFRKVVSICNAIDMLEIGDTMVWLDVDCFIKQELPNEFFKYFDDNDWLVIFRKKDWVESGIQFIKINEKTKDFAKFYLNYYLSGEVFEYEPQWADNWVIESCFKKYEGELKVNGLTPFFNCPIDINDFTQHSKQPLASVRDKEKI